jgi:accessory colonization factor AcfC
MTDDPINNIIDSMNNIAKSDTATVIMTIKPLPDKWNEKAKKQVDRLYKNLDLRPN